MSRVSTVLGFRDGQVGTDLSHDTLARARHGQYKPRDLRTLPDHYQQQYFTVLKSAADLVYQVAPRVQALVDFAYMNLCDPASTPPFPPPFIGGKGGGADVIFCQNVLIYFAPEDRPPIVQRLCQYLRPGDCLFLEPAEVIGLRLPGIQPVRLPNALLYQRTP